MIRIAIIGYGKIARDQHVPAMTKHGGYDLKAVVTTSGGGPDGVPVFASTEDMLAAMRGQIDAVAISTPPAPRYAIARQCLAAGLDMLLEKPPATTLGQIEELRDECAAAGRVLFTTWHSQYAAAVDQARDLLKDKRIASMRICWHEDVNKYHPGQDWVWGAGGFGVFDPGINALSIAVKIVPSRLILDDALLRIPANREQPIVARLKLSSPVADGPIEATFDWCPATEDEWTITVQPVDGPELVLRHGGSEIAVGGEVREPTGPGEYPGIYAEFAKLVAERRSHVDFQPLRIVADAFMTAKREAAPAFNWRT
ncbi:Gfo/Idh/MocA family protein [Sphingomonas tabacisoli]|uniref:Gfo/Idh/MocA family protein n=1 Tax=Sphingomonas tabacisoli TaxID=2249466 RepID=A0ABW4I4W8_9SPHN